jgi:hypothetical protein
LPAENTSGVPVGLETKRYPVAPETQEYLPEKHPKRQVLGRILKKTARCSCVSA